LKFLGINKNFIFYFGLGFGLFKFLDFSWVQFFSYTVAVMTDYGVEIKRTQIQAMYTDVIQIILFKHFCLYIS